MGLPTIFAATLPSGSTMRANVLRSHGHCVWAGRHRCDATRMTNYRSSRGSRVYGPAIADVSLATSGLHSSDSSKEMLSDSSRNDSRTMYEYAFSLRKKRNSRISSVRDASISMVRAAAMKSASRSGRISNRDTKLKPTSHLPQRECRSLRQRAPRHEARGSPSTRGESRG